MQSYNEQEASGAEFVVTIVACGPIEGGLVYAVTVTQPVQSWTVVRSHNDFLSVSNSLSQLLVGLPSCPVLSDDVMEFENTKDINVLVKARNDLQQWLCEVLMVPGARESPAIRNFLTAGANTIAPQFEQVIWTQFNVVLPPTSSETINESDASPESEARNVTSNVNVDDMEMDDMFIADDDGVLPVVHTDDHHETDIPSASERYKPTDEAVTDEDEMDIMQFAGEVEMIDDIGSLAQSLGASHVGRSLQLQAEMRRKIKPNDDNNIQSGLVMGSNALQTVQNGMGGLESAMKYAANSEHVNQKPSTSVPRLDSFKMIKVIGKGSFGKVFLVKEIKTGETYALKVLRKDNIVKRNQVEHTNTERSVLGYVRHPFIVGMNMAFQSRDKLYFVLDYCAGGELFFHLGKLGKFPEPRACFYAAEIILAINYVHSLDIIYRDLKPENVLLDAQGHIRLTDFGLSKEGISSSSSGANSFCGTPEYLAPEILNRQGHGRAVDWWSLGALLYEMITGLPPFYCQDRERLFKKIREAELTYPATITKPAKKVLQGLLTKDPNRRLGSGPTDSKEIQTQEFFQDMDWHKLMRGEIPAPWKPNITNSLDTSQFDKEFTKMPIFSPQSLQRSHGFDPSTEYNNLFDGFTFTDRRFQGFQTRAGS